MTAPRICSLLPSATEIVCALGLRDSLVAITHECDHPSGIENLPRITSSAIDHSSSSSREIHAHITASVHSGSSVYHLNQEMLDRLAPELVLTQELCDVCAVSYGVVKGAVRLMEGDCRVASLEPTTLQEIVASVCTVAELAGVVERGSEVADGLTGRLEAVQAATEGVSRRPAVFACEWLDPFFVGGHWVPEMIQAAGGTDPLGVAGSPSVTTTWEQVEKADPDVIVLMPCGYDLEQTLAEYARIEWPGRWRRLRAVAEGNVFAVDGSGFFNRPGPRIIDGVEILAEILHSGLFPRKRSETEWRRVN